MSHEYETHSRHIRDTGTNSTQEESHNNSTNAELHNGANHKMLERKVSQHGTSAEVHRQRLPVGDQNSACSELSKTDSTNGSPEEFQAHHHLGNQKMFNS